VFGADYSSCFSSTTSSTCTPVCQAGYTTIGASSGFDFACQDNGKLNAATDTGNLECLINTCRGSFRNGGTGGDYSSCTLQSTGDTCTPVCPPSYNSTGASAGFTLVCEDDGNFDAAADTGDLKCIVDTFGQNGFVRNAVANADYSTCALTRSTSCTPTCLPGFTKIGSSVGLTMVCNDGGVCDAASDDGNLVCLSNICNGKVWNEVSGADYSACSSMKTGETCTPVCPAGYISTGTTAVRPLVCQTNGAYDGKFLKCKSRTPLSSPVANQCSQMRGFRTLRTRTATCA
jgi:hypothetical protein